MTARRERTLVFLAVVLLTLFRSALFVFKAPLDFDSDQAVIGLMAKHLSEGRAFPLFFYGQNYMLAVEAWLAAPVFLLGGVSVATLKLPLLAINIAIGWLLITLFERDGGLRPLFGLIASLFFLLAPVATSALLLETNGGNVEPLLYTLLLWLTRRRPAWFGFIAAIGFLQREFTVYAVLAVMVVGMAHGWRRREQWRWLLSASRVAIEVWLVVQLLRPVASAAGPGTSVANLITPSNNLIEVFRRFCFDSRLLLGGLQRLVTVHWAQLFGTTVQAAEKFGIESQVVQGLPGSGLLLAATALLMVVRIAMHPRGDAGSTRPLRFCMYLTLVGVLSAAVFAIGRCGDVSLMRYDLLSLVGAVGVAGWFLTVERTGWIRHLVVAGIVAWAMVSAVGHARLWREYTSRPPLAAKTLIIRGLEARGVKYARSDYWIAYYVTFMTNERIIVAATDVPRIVEYEREIDDHRADAIHVSRAACGDKAPVPGGVYFC
jgi:hypothetical protein